MKVINIKDLRAKKSATEKENKLWELDDYFEYCFIDDYESIYDKFKVESIQVDDYFVSILEAKGKYHMVAVRFPKIYDVHEIVEFLDTHSFGFDEKGKDGYYIDNAAEIEKAVLYKGLPIVVATIGKDSVYISTDGLTEVTDSYEHYNSIVNPADASLVDVQKEMENDSAADWDDSITLGKQKTYLDDGRHVKVSAWADDGYTFITYSFSAAGIENYSDQEITLYLKQYGLSEVMNNKKFEIFHFVDQDANACRSINIVVGEPDD
ncbi:hypothetical protein EPH95_06020 [Salicibibacter halophilus]|uniref:Uncharacterized protein n=1 Tax=Salicibibacter halophilus TaxID=2502791 RepID=A0A514LG29_9BACI|nr:hypothetical protein [Salicibibacter halophilus]QDI90789.1 hypothetical protein EPH95_06020 [Salicibibacter halophilus]